MDTRENYVVAMQEHLQGMEASDTGEYRDIEKKTSALTSIWSHIWNANNRVRNNLITGNNDVPPLCGLRKDHKPDKAGCGGPPLRPVCGAITSCNRNLSYLLSQCIHPLISSAPEACDNTEDLLSRIQRINEEKKRPLLVAWMSRPCTPPSMLALQLTNVVNSYKQVTSSLKE